MADITSNLWVHLPLETGGNDVGPYGHHFAVESMPASFTTGVFNSGAATNGSGTWWYNNAAGLASLTGINQYTVSCYARSSFLGGSLLFAWAFDHSNSNPNFLVGLSPYDFTSAAYGPVIYMNGATRLDSNAGPSPDNVWRLWTWVQSGGTGYLYQNTTLVNTVTGLPSLSTFNEIGVGGRKGHPSQRMSGAIDEFRIYTRVLTSGDIVDLYNYRAVTGTGMSIVYGNIPYMSNNNGAVATTQKIGNSAFDGGLRTGLIGSNQFIKSLNTGVYSRRFKQTFPSSFTTGVNYVIYVNNTTGGPLNLTSFATKNLIFTRPDGDNLSVSPSYVTDGINGGLYYAATGSQFSIPGRWLLKVQLDTLYSDTYKFEIRS